MTQDRAVAAPMAEMQAAEMEQRRVALSFLLSFLGFALIAASYLAGWTFERTGDVPHLSALLGAVLLGAPHIWRAINNLFRGERTMIELVAIAIIACMALGKYQEAGIVAFLMLLADLIQSRSALGARQAIEGLVRMTPSTAHLI